MIKKYFAHIQSKKPHHRRQHAVQVAGILTAVAFVVWITTLSVRFAGTAPVAAAPDDGSSDVQQTQLAGAAASDDATTPGVEVVGTSTDGSSNFSNY